MREIVLVIVGELVTVLSRTAALLAGSIFIAPDELAIVGNANDRLAASGQWSIGASTEHCLLVEDVCLPIVGSFGNTSRVEVASAG